MTGAPELLLAALNKSDSRWESAIRRFKAATQKSPHYRRSCGDCKECCTTMGVHELPKPACVTCKHLAGRGCSIYPERPPSCASYECLWLSGITPEGWQPNKYGIIMDISLVDPKDKEKGLGFFIREIKKGSFASNQERYAQSIALAARLCMATADMRHIGLHYWATTWALVYKLTSVGSEVKLERLS